MSYKEIIELILQLASRLIIVFEGIRDIAGRLVQAKVKRGDSK